MKQTAPKVGLVSLGCPKALVDSERILTRLRAEGYEVSDSYDGADAVIVNTCGFLDSARAESLETKRPFAVSIPAYCLLPDHISMKRWSMPSITCCRPCMTRSLIWSPHRV